jgi:predicted 3-demethylubiquinone-9 3-methyltransferase (glyoxalase superfamily)
LASKSKLGELYAKNHSILVVRRQRGRGDEFLRFNFQEFKGSEGYSIWRSRARPERDGNVRDIPTRWTKLFRTHGAPQFGFTPAISFFVNCETQQEVDELWEKLSAGGQEERCGWLKDKYALSWQIIPTALGEMLGDKDPAKASKVIQAMLQMNKIDVEGLKQAYDGE